MRVNIDGTSQRAVLSAFLEACPKPTPEQIADWRSRFPKFANDISELANMVLDEAASDDKDHQTKQREEQFRLGREETLALMKVLEREKSRPFAAAASAKEATALNTFGSRLKSARESQGLTQGDILRRVVLRHDIKWLAGVESDALPADDTSVESLARALNVSGLYLTNPRDLHLVDVSPRNGHNLSTQKLRWVEVRAIDFAHRYLELEDALGETQPSLTPVSMATLEEAEQVAFYLRADWGLGYGPIPSLTSVLEDRGVKILPLDLGSADGFALFINEGRFPKTQIIVIGESRPVKRRRFTLAHELAHIVDPNASEAVANRFAGAFLLPARIVKSRLADANSRDISKFIAIKNEFGVSLQAIGYRCYELGLLTETERNTLFGIFYNSGSDDSDFNGFNEVPARFDALSQRAKG